MVRRLHRQSSVFDAMRLVGVGAEAPMFVRFVISIVAFEPDYLAIAFEGEDMGGDAIEEPAIMGDDHGASGEVEDGLLQGL